MHATTCGANQNLVSAVRRLSTHHSWPFEQGANMPSTLLLASLHTVVFSPAPGGSAAGMRCVHRMPFNLIFSTLASRASTSGQCLEGCTTEHGPALCRRSCSAGAAA